MWKLSTILSIAISAHCLAINAKEKCKHSDTSFECVKFIKNYDGDTVTFKIPNVHPLFGNNISVRIKGIDTPEIKAKNNCEKGIAQKAKLIVYNRLSKSKRIDLKNISRGKYFRIIADVIVDGKSISDDLIGRKVASIYNGRGKKKANWCRR